MVESGVDFEASEQNQAAKSTPGVIKSKVYILQ